MKSFFAASAMFVLAYASSAGPAQAVQLQCNPASSNWANASPVTCPFNSGSQAAEARPQRHYARTDEHECEHDDGYDQTPK